MSKGCNGAMVQRRAGKVKGFSFSVRPSIFPVLERSVRLRVLASMRRLAGNWFCYEKSSLGLPGPGSNFPHRCLGNRNGTGAGGHVLVIFTAASVPRAFAGAVWL